MDFFLLRKSKNKKNARISLRKKIGEVWTFNLNSDS